MSSSDKISSKEIIAVVVVLVLIAIGMFITLGKFSAESELKEVVVSDLGAKEEDHLEIFVKLLSVDPIKGDASTRLEFAPHGALAGEDGTLKHDLKFFMPSANGKTEVEFKKGKAMPPVEAVFSMYGGTASDYPFDKHKAWFFLSAERSGADKEKKPEKPVAASDEDEPKPAAPAAEPASNEVPLDVSFFGNLPGYSISVARSKDTDAEYVAADIQIERSGSVVAFSLFVGFLMWALAIAVLFLVASLLIRGRKIEIAMFSFMAALLFAFYSVRGSQPNVPPIGVFSDFVSFFWAEILVALCLVASVIAWVFRTPKA